MVVNLSLFVYFVNCCKAVIHDGIKTYNFGEELGLGIILEII